jgi:2-polyprenyl-3-methyl-5-hydroxy-6-metoxy-1,4-benzoquinol methylase
MVCRHGRVIRPEWLDDTPVEDAAPSLRDLVFINRLLGGHKVIRDRLSELYAWDDSFTMLDVGAASGDTGRVVRERHPRAIVTSVDYRQDHLHNAAPPKLVADAFRLPFAAGSFDIVFCSLFLHHFTDDQIVALLRGFAAVSRRLVFVSDLERHPLAYYFLPATRWLLRWNRITLHDGPISVEAAFRPEELRTLAVRAGLTNIDLRTHRPAFRLSMLADARVL